MSDRNASTMRQLAVVFVMAAILLLASASMLPVQAAGGAKTFVNRTSSPVSVSLFVREGDNPANLAGTVSFDLKAGETKNIQYGNATNIYRRGYSLSTAFNGATFSQNATITVRGSSLDNQWNTNSVFEINFAQSSFTVNAHN